MNVLLLVLASFCVASPQDNQKATPPGKSLSSPFEAELRGLGTCVESREDRIKNINTAFDFGQRAAKEDDNTKSWAMYQVAIEFANIAGEARIAHSFTQEVMDRWKVPQDFLPEWYTRTIILSNNPPETSADSKAAEIAWLMAEDTKHLTAKDSIEKWDKIFESLRDFAGDTESEHTKRACTEPFSQIKAWLWIAKQSAKDNNDAEAFRMILSGGVDSGIEKLAESSNTSLSQLVKAVSKSEMPFSNEHQRLLETLTASKSEAAQLSAQRIFESWLPNLTPEQIETCQPVCYRMTEPLPLRDDFSLPYHGILRNGYLPLAQERTIPKRFAFDEELKHWTCKGDGTIEWPRLPFENYVQETVLTVDKLNNHVNLYFGTEDSVRILLQKKDDKIRARLSRHLGGRYNWKGSRAFAVGEKLAIKVYRTPERMFAFINGKKMNSRYFGLGWHKFRITVGSGSQATVSSIKTRPWLPGDREVLRKLAGEHKSIDMTALKFQPPSQEEYRKYFRGYDGLKFKMEKGKPYVTDQEIVMQPVGAGRFERPGDSRTVSISKDFHCSAHEITQKQFTELMEFNPSSAQGNPHLPVDNVTMAEAIEFCERLNEAQSRFDGVPEGYEYRLPTEAEWTLAAMANGKTQMDVPEAECWHCGTCQGGFRTVGTSSPSARGIYDMHGNVEELTLTEHSKRKAPKDGDDKKELEELVDPVSLPSAKSRIVVKGGSWNVGAHLSAANKRERRHQGRTPGRGFRVVLAPIVK